ncbi:hypothetical protein BDW74DRAFT_176594 [Aspergillus multicolor]|uniref:uncharacterized protein n=1 Tax=Aspergillus multicolor TaxID=41759 RepID=UPI003CCDBCDD
MSRSKVNDERFDEEVSILIVGGGPSGLLLAFLLAQLNSVFGLKSPTFPFPHALSPRSLEICRQFGLDINEIRALGTSRADAFWVNFITNLSVKQVGRLPYERMDPEVLDATPAMIHNIPQPAFEESVAGELAQKSLNEVRKNHSFVRLQQRESYVFTTIEDRSSNREYIVKSGHVVACDGVKSAVRRFLGVDSEGEDSYETMMTIHFNAELRLVVGNRVGMLHWIMDPEVAGFVIAYDLSGNQVLICNIDPKKHPVGSWNESLCRKTVNAAIGRDIPYDVLSFRPWILSRKVANEYRVGRVFLAGDATHSFPPTGGLGLNTGLGDVHNLAYKLAAVHQGCAGDAILNTYESDRRQVSIVNAQQSVKNGQQIFGLLKALGTTDENVEVARHNLHRNIQDPGAMVEINKGIEGQREHFDILGLHIGYVYGDTQIPRNASEDVERKQFSTLDLCPFDAFAIFVDSMWADKWTSYISEIRKHFPTSHSRMIKIVTAVAGVDFKLPPGEQGLNWSRLMRLRDGQATLVRPDQHILATFDSTTAKAVDLVGSLREHLA